jgi:hypothetical protein
VLEKLVGGAIVSRDDLGMIVSNIGVDPGFSAIYTSNAAMHTAFVQVGLKAGHKTGSYEYMAQVKARMEQECRSCSRLTFRPAAWWMRC